MHQDAIVKANDPPVMFVTGKGGVGKSLVAVSIARQFAAMGKNVCLLQCSIEDQNGPLLGKSMERHSLTQLTEKIYGLNLDMDLNFRDFFANKLGMTLLVEKLFDQPLVRSFLGIIPGVKELAFLGRVYHMKELQKDPKFDVVILDGFSSGHFLHLMTTPSAVFDSGVVGAVLKETQKVNQFFKDKAVCGLIHVTTPDVLAVSETLEFMEKFDRLSPINSHGMVVNKFPLDLYNHSNSRDQVQEPLQPIFDARMRRAKEALASIKAERQNDSTLNDSPIWILPDYGAITDKTTIKVKNLSDWEAENVG